MQALFKQLDMRQLVLLLGGLFILLAVTLVSYIVVPQFKQLRALQSTYQLLDQVRGDGQNLAQDLEQMQQALHVVRKKLHGDIANLPVRQIEAVIIGRLQKISWQNEMELISVQPGVGQRVQMFDEALFQVNLSGDYFKFYSWLRDLHKELGYVVIKQFEIKPLASVDDEPHLSVNLTMVSYRAAAS